MATAYPSQSRRNVSGLDRQVDFMKAGTLPPLKTKPPSVILDIPQSKILVVKPYTLTTHSPLTGRQALQIINRKSIVQIGYRL